MVIFGNIAYYGQERANIELFKTLSDKVEPIFLTNHKWGHLHIHPVLDEFGFKWEKMKYVFPFRKDDNIRTWLYNLYYLCSSNLSLIRFLKKYKTSYIHIGNDFFFMTLIPVLIFARTPIIFYIVDRPIQHFSIYKFLWKKIIGKKVSFFACISDYIKNELLKLKVQIDKIDVVYTVIPERNEILPEVMIEIKQTFKIDYFGQITEIKGIGLLIEAFLNLCKKYDDLQLLIAGSLHFTNVYANKMLEYVKMIKYENKILFLDYVENIPDLLQKSNLHIAPSIKEEPLGIVVLEAKKSNIPSIIFNSGGLTEMVEHKVDGYICYEKSSNEIEKAVEFFYNLPDKGKIFGDNAKKSLEKLPFNIEQFKQKWIKIYDL